jgi:hypothetical protein
MDLFLEMAVKDTEIGKIHTAGLPLSLINRQSDSK